MFSATSRIQRLWPDKDRLLCNRELMGALGQNIQIGTSTGSFRKEARCLEKPDTMADKDDLIGICTQPDESSKFWAGLSNRSNKAHDQATSRFALRKTLVLALSLLALVGQVTGRQHKPGPTPSPTPNAVPATTDSATNPIGYKLYTGVASGIYGTPIDVGNVTTTSLTLQGATTYYFVVTYNAAKVESPYSNEVSYVAP
jgi:hypothetical protein